MASLTEDGLWVGGIYALEATDVVGVGGDGASNVQPAELSNRTACLLTVLLDLVVDGWRAASADGSYADDFHALAVADNGVLIAAGENGEIQRSTDNGRTWTHVSLGEDAYVGVWRAAAFGGGVFVLAGDEAELRSSSDYGLTWDSLDPPTADILALTYGGGQFVGVGVEGIIITSPDAEEWTEQESGVGETLQTVFCGGGLFVVGGQLGIIITSPDAEEWTERDAAAAYEGTFVAGVYADGLFVLGSSARQVQVSADGVEWSVAADDIIGIDVLAGLSYELGLFIALGPGGWVATALGGTAGGPTSAQSWTARRTPFAANLWAILSVDGRPVVVGSSGLLAVGSKVALAAPPPEV
jgi:photosystem II stability/assembly factor-like uncharacterized protein